MFIRGIFIILLCSVMVGCTTVSKTKELERQLSEKDAELRALQEQLAAKETQIKEKDLKIKELKKKLEGFGVFE